MKYARQCMRRSDNVRSIPCVRNWTWTLLAGPHPTPPNPPAVTSSAGAHKHRSWKCLTRQLRHLTGRNMCKFGSLVYGAVNHIIYLYGLVFFPGSQTCIGGRWRSCEAYPRSTPRSIAPKHTPKQTPKMKIIFEGLLMVVVWRSWVATLASCCL